MNNGGERPRKTKKANSKSERQRQIMKENDKCDNVSIDTKKKTNHNNV